MASKSLIEIKEHKGIKVVDSFTLYNSINLHRTHYSRWIKFYKMRGGLNIDWFIDDDLLKLNRKIKKRYYFTLEFARGICIRYITKESNELIVFLKEEINKKEE